MENRIRTITRIDDPYIGEFAMEMHSRADRPLHASGTPLSVPEIIDTIEHDIRSGVFYRIEMDGWGRLLKSRRFGTEHTEGETLAGNDADDRNALLGDIDGWKEGRVFDPDKEPDDE